MSAYSTAHIDYLQRLGLTPSPVSANTKVTTVPVQMRRLFRVKEIGVFQKQWDAKSRQASDRRVSLPTEDVVVGLYGCNIPVAFLIRGKKGWVTINLGVWSPSYKPVQSKEMDDQEEMLKASLNSLYPAVVYGPPETDLALAAGGLVVGTPTAKLPDAQDGALAVDRLIRALSGENWACLILAWPLPEESVSQMRALVINEMRTVQSAVQAEHAPSPLADQYIELLKPLAKTLTSGQAAGAWRTAVYLLGDASSYRKLASLWRGIYSGDESAPEPVHVWDFPQAIELAANWSMPDTKCPEGPGIYRHPLESQTIHSSAQLAAYIHLPQIETNGFSLKLVPGFDTVPAVASGALPIRLGKVVPRSKLLPPDVPKDQAPDDWARAWYEKELPETYYEVGLKALTKHVFIAGVTGAGKTKTVFQILKKVAAAGVPFLVIEPAKTEYRELLLHEEIGGNLQVFTPGNELVSPFRLNPFEVLPGTSIAEHIDLLRSVFSVSFGLWTPLPQILEQCLHLAYQDKGWDITRDFNRRADNKPDEHDPLSFPTLSEFLQKVDEETQKLQWDKEAVGRIRGALHDRLKSLRAGGKGRMFDTRRSLPAELLFERPTVLELEGLGDDDDKAFMMGLLFIRLCEYRRRPSTHTAGSPQTLPLKHLLVFEEAHRLLSNVGTKGEQGEANPRAKAVESFSNLLSEIRAYGQGVIIADQVPVKLAPDVIKNTNLKIAHRVVDAEDRKVLAGSMQMNEQQAQAIGTLLPGRAAIFAEGDDAPLLVQIPLCEDKQSPNDEHVRLTMLNSKILSPHREIFLAHTGCTDTDKEGGAACEAARNIVESPAFQRDFNRLVISLIDDSTALDRLWPPIESRMNEALCSGVDKTKLTDCLIRRATEWFGSCRGSQSGWLYSQTAELCERLREALVNGSGASKAVKSLQQCLLALHVRKVPPYPHCERICDQKSALCLYRRFVSDMVPNEDFTGLWNASDPLIAQTKTASWNVCQKVARQLVEWNPKQLGAIRRIGLCYGQMMLQAYPLKVSPEYSDAVFEMIRVEAQADGSPPSA